MRIPSAKMHPIEDRFESNTSKNIILEPCASQLRPMHKAQKQLKMHVEGVFLG